MPLQSSGQKLFTGSLLLALVIVASPALQAQSLDLNTPTPVRGIEVLGAIAARDLGDSRNTDHFYKFIGNPGDLLITIESRNLNGDIDVFTAAGLRPLLKSTVYAESITPVTRSIYLRRREELILRVEARSPNDDEGSYRIRFGGSFEALSGPDLAEEDARSEADALAARAGKPGRRVSSVGARIEEPRPEVAEAPTPEPEPSPTLKEETKPAEPDPRRVSSPRRSTSRRPTARPAPTTKTEKVDEAAPAETTKPEVNPAAEITPSPPAASRRGARRTPARPAPSAPPEPEPESGPRLVIETRNGTLIDRFMSSVRRVTVENNQVVVVWKDGRVQRIPLADIARMSIGP